MTQYAMYVREEFGIPLDRLYYGGIGLHPKLTAYLWRWESGQEFDHREMPQEVFERRNELFSPDEPFCVFEQGRAEYIRFKDTDPYIPPDTEKWFRSGGYKDYFALPDIHRGFFKGGLAWSTKNPDGFSDDDIQFFQLTHSALTTIMRLHTNDLVLRTLTDRMEKEIEDRTAELATANQKLEQASVEITKQSAKQLEHFASMSHEIRTPLNCIVGLSSLLMDSGENLSEAHKDSVTMIHSSADLLAGVVNDVLDYAKLESGHFEVDIKSVDLQSVLDSVVLSISNKIMDKNVKVRTSYCGMLPRKINTDSRRLQQILYNLLGNAGKFSREGTNIDFSVRVVREMEQNKIEFVVKDYGKGIDKKDVESIFKPFSQASKETQTIYGGTGLGLSITRKLVSKLGGTISVDSVPEKYAKFIVELPYDGEIIDPSFYKEKLSDVTIVLLDQEERYTNTFSMEDDFMPLCPSSMKEAGVEVMRCSSWKGLEEKLRAHGAGGHYALLVEKNLRDEAAVERIHEIVGKKKCSWFTFGPTTADRHARHFKSLTGIFPSVLLENISKEVAADRQGDSLNGFDSLFSKLETNDHNSNIHCRSTITDVSQSNLVHTVNPVVKEEPKCQSTKKLSIAEDTPLKALKVLYAEDNIVNQKVMGKVLSRLGVEDVTIVDNGLKAVELCKTIKYDCIFMDMDMPIMDGVEACEKIIEQNPIEQVIFVTAHALDTFKEQADAAGAVGFISKPFNMQKIKSILEATKDGICY